MHHTSQNPNDGELFSDNQPQKTSDKNSAAESDTNYLPRIIGKEKNAVHNFIEFYGNLIWSLARKYSDSDVAAEILTREIFLAIWKNAENFDGEKMNEKSFVLMIALRCLMLKNNDS